MIRAAIEIGGTLLIGGGVFVGGLYFISWVRRLRKQLADEEKVKETRP